MIYLFHGTDTEKVRSKAFAWVEAARAKEPNLTYLRVAREELSPETLDEVAAARSLFAKRMLILLDDPYGSGSKPPREEEGETTRDASLLDERLPLLAASENVVVIVAPKLLLTKARRLSAHAARAYAFDARAEREVRGFNSNLVNALARMSREALWVELSRARRAGDAPEMLHGLLHWKARDLLEKSARSVERSRARKLSMDLITLLMESRRSGSDLGESLERFALSLPGRD